MKKIAWIGTGVMGAPMARHLANAGYQVSAYNRTHSKAQALEPLIKAYETIAETVSSADIIFTIVGYPKDVEEVTLEIMEHAKEGAIIVDMTTSSPSLAKKLYTIGKDKGYHVMDAPVTGGDLGAINATLSIMVGGDKDTYEIVLPLLEIMGKTINYMGVAGNGQHAKLANQTAIAGAIAGTAESLAYADKHGLNLETMLAVISGGSASSWQAINNGPKMIHKDYAPGFFIKHFLKDLNLVIEEKSDLYLPVVEKVASIYDILVKNGYEDDGTQAVIDYYSKKLK